MAEESKIIEEVVSQVEESKTEESKFDASAFTGYESDKKGNTLDKETVEEAVEESQKVDLEVENSEESSKDADGFSWEDVETKSEDVQEDSEVVEEEPKEEDWDEENVEKQEDQSKPVEINWSEMGQELNINANTKEEFVKQVKQMVETPIQDNDVVGNLKGFLELTDKDLVIADLKAANYDDEYINDTVDRMEDAGLIKREATTIRHQLNKHITTERQNLVATKKKAEKEEKQKSLESKKGLQKLIKGKDEFFGGKVSPTEKKNLYNYIIKGNFAEEVFSNHANVADAAFLWRNKQKIFKMIRTQGVEQGKSTVLNGITSPSRNSSNTMNYAPKGKGFNPNDFLKK